MSRFYVISHSHRRVQLHRTGAAVSIVPVNDTTKKSVVKTLVSANGGGWKGSKNIRLIFGSKPDKQKKTREKPLFRRGINSGQNESFNTSSSGKSENCSYLCSDPEDNVQRWGATRNVGAHGLEESSKQESSRVPVFISKYNQQYEKHNVRLCWNMINRLSHHVTKFSPYVI